MYEVKDEEGYEWLDEVIDGLDDETYAKYEAAQIEQLKQETKRREEWGYYDENSTFDW